MSDIDPAVIEAAAKAIHHAQWLTGGDHWAGVCAAECWETDSDVDREEYRRVARAGLVAAVPHLRRSLADELDAARKAYLAEREGLNADEYERGDGNGYNRAMFDAAHLVRGEP